MSRDREREQTKSFAFLVTPCLLAREGIVRSWPWIFFWPVPLFAGCAATPTAPLPPIDKAAPAQVETATFALG